ncbi:MAG: hypothetical protein GY842_10175 [bacterium]|nr:hypothetical protein [bacterium]
MGRRGRRESRFTRAGATDAREALERRWHPRLTLERQLAAWVTAGGTRGEPFHRWTRYRQGFSPKLVRHFLRAAESMPPKPTAGPLLDPFAGSGTFTLECARRNVSALGVEALASLAFLSTVTAATDLPPLPDLADCSSWETVADRLTLPLHRAALMLAVASRHTATGKPDPQAPPLSAALDSTLAMIAEDLRVPLPRLNPVQQGDARRLKEIESASIGGVLTSPPYLSRYDYTRAQRPLEQVYAHWYADRSPNQRRSDQMAAHPGASSRRTAASPPHPSVVECVGALVAGGEEKLSVVVQAYFQDLAEVLTACRRVLRTSAPCWIVIGGARLKGVYVPADLILAEMAESHGFAVVDIHVARRLIPSGRKLGNLTNVAPRESIVVLRTE